MPKIPLDEEMKMSFNNEEPEEYSSDIYTPQMILGIFNNALKADVEMKPLLLRGIYVNDGKKNYGGYFYDRIKEEANPLQSITTKTPELIRGKVKDGEVYIFKGYLDRKIDQQGSITLRFNISEVLSQRERQISDRDIEKARVMHLKSDSGYKNLDTMIENMLSRDEKPHIALVYGTTGVVDKDFNTAIKDARAKYNFTEHRINLSSKEEIINKLEEIGSSPSYYDAVAIIRGGGSGLEIFNDIDVAKKAALLKPTFITAIGHAEDVSLLDQIADKSFTTPTALGSYLKEKVDKVEEDIKHSKAKLIEDIERDIARSYKERITTLERNNRILKLTILLLIISGILGGVLLFTLL